jgi:hypothetical protein
MQLFRTLLESKDFQQICTIADDEKEFLRFVKVKKTEIDRYRFFLRSIGFRTEKKKERNFNFELVFTENYFLSKSTAKIVRSDGKITVNLHKSIFEPNGLQNGVGRLITVLKNYPLGVEKIFDHSFKISETEFFYLDLDDGGHIYKQKVTADSNVYAFTRRKEVTSIGLIPDPYTLNDMAMGVNYPEYKNEVIALNEYWKRRKATFWRGSTTGRTIARQLSSNERVQFCREALQYEHLVDAKITDIAHEPDRKDGLVELEKMGVLGTRVRESEFAKYQAFIDLDGNSCGWGTFRKYLRLIHVIKPDSGYEMFYYFWQPEDSLTRVRDTRHLFDLLETESNFANNFEVAWKGYQFATKMREKIRAGEATVFPN